jgi:hypothetical protein
MPPSGLPFSHTLATYNHPQGQGCHAFCYLSLFAHGSSPRPANHAKTPGKLIIARMHRLQPGRCP